MRLALNLFLVALLATAAGCPKRKYRAIPDVPTSGDASARDRFSEARSRFERDARREKMDAAVAEEFEAIARDYANDPVAPYALLYAGISSVRAGEPAKALESLEALFERDDADEALVRRGQLYRGLALVYAGRADQAIKSLVAGKGALRDDDEKVEWLGATAEAHAAAGNKRKAIAAYDAYYARARVGEQAYALSRIRELGAGLSEGELRLLLESVSDRGPAIAVLGERVGGEAARDARDARKALGLASLEIGSGDADPNLVGALLPLSGRRGRVGEVALRGLSVATGSYSARRGRGVARSGEPRPFSLEVVDSQSQSASAAAAARELAEMRVVGLVGPIDRRSVDAVGTEAMRHGLPVLSLDPRAESGEGMGTVFHIMHSAEDRARSLARYAVGKGIMDFAILGPKSGYGRAVGGAFRDEVARLGGKVVVQVTYEPEETSFGKTVKRLRKPWKALFVADRSRRLELLAPALAAANFVSQPLGARRPRRGRGFLLLSTAEALSDGLLRRAGRYTKGAVLAPGFYADRDDRRIASFVARFEAGHGRSPSALEAYAYDAALVLRAAVEAGAASRDAVLRFLGDRSVVGVTGEISFDGARRRRDRGVLFTVSTSETGEPGIRALR